MVALVLQEFIFPLIYKDPAWHASVIGSDNTPTVLWTFKEASTIINVVTKLLRIRSIINHQAYTAPSVFFYPGVDNTMSDNGLPRFDI